MMITTYGIQCVYIYTHIIVYTCIYIYIYTHLSLYLSIYLSISLSLYIYIYIYVHSYTLHILYIRWPRANIGLTDFSSGGQPHAKVFHTPFQTQSPTLFHTPLKGYGTATACGQPPPSAAHGHMA